MPYLTQLRVSNFRNISSVLLTPSTRINIIHGQNGAGKSSLLESISVLSLGRSFRTRKYRHLIQTNTQDFVVYGEIGERESADTHNIGVQRAVNGESRFRIDGSNVNSSAQLTVHLPTLVIDAYSFNLLSGSAKERRMFFDWLVFHVKHSFGELWKQYVRCVKQRNSLLRRDKITYSMLEPWDVEIARLAKQIDDDRRATFSLYIESLAGVLDQFEIGDHTLSIDYKNGWKDEIETEEGFRAKLRECFDRDRKQGYTTLGAHRAEFSVSIGKTPAVEILSRGQQKLLVSALVINKAKVFSEQKNETPVFLIDDMPAELDILHMNTVASWINKLEVQAFVTAIHKESLVEEVWPNSESTKLFHVKHGTIIE